MPPPLAILGIPTIPMVATKRDGIRQTWMRSIPFDMRVAFLLGADGSSDQEMLSEMTQHGDLCVVPGKNYTDTNLHIDQKCFEFLRAVLIRFVHTPFVILADDDAYVNLPQLATDLRTWRTESRLLYGGVEWYAWDNSTGRNEGWGAGIADAVTRHPAGKKNYNAHFSATFPYLKGPLMVFGASVASELVFGQHGRMVQEHSARINRRVNIDVLIGYILSTAAGGMGMPNLKWIDIGTSRMANSKHRHGFLELRSGRNLTDPESACYRVVHFGTGKRNGIAEGIRGKGGRNLAKLIAPASHLYYRRRKLSGIDVMRAGMTTLVSLRCKFPPLSYNATNTLSSCESYAHVRKFSHLHGPPQAAMSFGGSWTLCEVWRTRTRTYEHWRPPRQSKRAKMLRSQGLRWPPPGLETWRGRGGSLDGTVFK